MKEELESIKSQFPLIINSSSFIAIFFFNNPLRRDNDCIEHDAIRIEPPVYNTEISVVYEDNEFLVINKPPSMPVKNHSFTQM